LRGLSATAELSVKNTELCMTVRIVQARPSCVPVSEGARHVSDS